LPMARDITAVQLAINNSQSLTVQISFQND
jgi:hypothetical protein